MVKHAGGRPTKYTKELLEACHHYIDNYQDYGDAIPSHMGMFLEVGISKTCAYDWGKDETKPEFSEILDKCMKKQARILINSGLTNEFNSAITKLVLGKHGYHDKVDNTNDNTHTIQGDVHFVGRTVED